MLEVADIFRAIVRLIAPRTACCPVSYRPCRILRRVAPLTLAAS